MTTRVAICCARMKIARTAALFGCLLASSACGQRAAHKTTEGAKGAMQSAPLTIDEATKTVLRSADLVVLGEVLAIDASPGAWSSRLIAYQRVEYRILRVLKASAKVQLADKVSVLHPLIKGKPTVDAKEPRLSGELFRIGQRLIVAIQRDEADGALQAVDAERAVMVAVDELIAGVEHVL